MNVAEIIAALEKIDAESECGGISRLFLEIARTGANKEEVTFRGNREGLIHLGLLCLDLARRKSEGSHYHFDEVSISSAEVPVVVAYKSASWDHEQKG